jgi:DNA repair protein RAD7
VSVARYTEEDVPWEPSRDPSLGPRPCAPVPSLFSLSVKLLVNHINAVTSLWGVPDPIRSQLAAAVCAQRKLSPEVALLFGQDTTTELVIPDCSQLDAKAMAGLLQMLLLGGKPGPEDGSNGNGEPPSSSSPAAAEAGASPEPAAAAAATAARLERLELGSCGRGFDDKAAVLVACAGPLSGLRVCRLTGAYRLGDSGLLQLLGAAPDLLELAVPSAPRLTGTLCVFGGWGGGHFDTVHSTGAFV